MTFRKYAGAANRSLQQLAFTRAMNLPAAAQRRLAGRPVVVDGQTLAVDTQLMLKLQRLAGPATETVPVPQGRTILRDQAVMAGGRPEVGSVRSLKVDGRPARLYVPTGAPAVGPLLIYIHGGGFVFGDLDSHDAPCRVLAEKGQVRVLAVTYRLAPEAPFPAAYDDCLAAFDWVLENADELGADPARLAVGGDSAGGNLAAGVALARPGKLAFQLLIYPVTDRGDAQTQSRKLFAKGFYLTSEFIALANESYVPSDVDPADPRVSPIYADVPDGVAPAYIVTAGFDPLRDEGEAYAEKLREAGVKVEQHRYPGLIHGFFNIVGAGRSARAAVEEIALKLRESL